MDSCVSSRWLIAHTRCARLPNLKGAFSHGGGAFPATLGRIEQGFRVRPDLCAKKNDKSPKSYVGKFWVDSLTHDERMLNFIVDQWGAKRVLVGRRRE